MLRAALSSSFTNEFMEKGMYVTMGHSIALFGYIEYTLDKGSTDPKCGIDATAKLVAQDCLFFSLGACDDCQLSASGYIFESSEPVVYDKKSFICKEFFKLTAREPLTRRQHTGAIQL